MDDAGLAADIQHNNRTIADIMDQALSLNRTLGFKTIVFEPGKSSVRIEKSALHENHVGTIHAGVLFSLAEYASGSTLMGAIIEDMDKIFAVVKTGHIEFLSAAPGAVIASGELPLSTIQQAKADVLDGHKVDIPVAIDIRCEGGDNIIARCTFNWALRKMKAA